MTNRKQRRRRVAGLRALAAPGMTFGEVGYLEGGWDCDCTFCRLVRAGVCLKCAKLVRTLKHRCARAHIEVSLCSAACRDGLERHVAEQRR